MSFSNHGTGVMIHGVERRPDGRVEFTSWLCLLWVPLLPLRSWSGVYLGEGIGDGANDEPHLFADLRRIPHDWTRLYLTFARSLLLISCAVAPAYFMIHRTAGRAATRVEMVVVFSSVVWAAGLILWSGYARRRRLRG